MSRGCASDQLTRSWLVAILKRGVRAWPHHGDEYEYETAQELAWKKNSDSSLLDSSFQEIRLDSHSFTLQPYSYRDPGGSSWES